MNRTEVIQKIIDRQKAKNYLEIGVNNGVNFFKIRAPQKAAVDPKFCYTLRRKVSWTLRNWTNWKARYFEVTSDDYFAKVGVTASCDVAFIDGLHTHEQSLKDALHVIDRLTPGGVIVMHDCNPPNRAAATPAESLEHASVMDVPGVGEAWCGDVWKTICHLRSQREDLRVFVLDCDHGLGIVTRGKPDTALALTLDQLAAMSYDDLARDKKYFLNLKDSSYLSHFLATLQSK